MIGLLGAAAAARPDQVAVIGPSGERTWARLHAEALRVAGGLRARGIERFGIVETDIARVIPLLAGAALAGAEPCQYAGDVSPADLAGQASELDHRVVVATRQDLGGDFEVLAPAALSGPEPDDVPAGPQPVIILTTGTTGRPKPVRHDWTDLVRAVTRVGPRPEQRWLLAYGPHQFAGTQVLLHVLAAQATIVAPFPRQPRDGLRAILEHQVTCVSATPTYWRFLLAEARSADARLPRLEQVTLGGEASPPDLLDELRRTFRDARVSHVYASTEFGSVVSVSDGRPGVSASALYGDGNQDGRLRIVDGELWIRTDAGVPGSQVLDSVEDDSADLAGWRPTGDLVEVIGDRMLFRGRASELINVGGVKVHPLPVEERINALANVAAARVYGRANPLVGAVVAVEVVLGPGSQTDIEGLRADIDDAVADLPAAWRPRSVRVVDEVVTRGGKTLRTT